MFLEGVARRAFGMSGGGEPVFTDEAQTPVMRRPKIALALGSGAARGWAHIGVLKALAEAGVPVDIVTGASMGAVVGGCFAAGKLDELEDFALSLTRTRVVGLMDVQISGSGLIAGARLRHRLDRHLGDIGIENLPMAFTAIATELQTGHEIWLTKGRLVDALCASYALPGIFDPVNIGGRWLMDGALVNPVPVTAARALGADVVIAVNLNGDMVSKGTVIYSHGATYENAPAPAAALETTRSFRAQMRDAANRINPFQRREVAGPGIAAVMIDAFNITQDRIARSRLAGDPPDILVAPRVARVGLFDFQRAAEAIEAGREAIARALEEIRFVSGASVNA
ncbi:patatin-like phospholipase family protein [Terrarubrum flagellatum]|uniref:patatin-like phospholipase family protein n=1 Tax=Terrirubrum flagellatum TaxID=2895980 RepID=UPI0031451EB3